jgi:chromosome partitioning protein
MRIIAIANQKGGCAKTTTVVNLAASLADTGFKVLVIDLDPQANATQWLSPQQELAGSLGLMTTKDPIEDLVAQTSIPGVDLIAGSQSLTTIEKALAGELGAEFTLKRRLMAIAPNSWDFVLIDTPPTLGLVTVNALSYAKELLIPVTTHIMTLSGVAQLMQKTADIREILNPDLKIVGLLPSRVDLRTKHSKEVLDMLTAEFKDKVFKSIIRENIRLAEAPSFHESILIYDKNSTAASDFRALAKEISSLVP